MRKEPKHNKHFKTEKEPRSIEEPAKYKDMNISWQLGILDIESNWGLRNHGNLNNFFEYELLPKLKSFESMSWNDLEKQTHGKNGKSKHHSIEVSKIIKDAQKRLQELKFDDIDELFSLRLDGKFRIWGIRKFGFLQILWIDKNHEIYQINR